MENEPEPGPSSNSGIEAQVAEGAVGGAGAEVSFSSFILWVMMQFSWMDVSLQI